MSTKEEEIILEQKPIVNGNMPEILEQVLSFNNEYLKFLKNELEATKKQLEETRNNG